MDREQKQIGITVHHGAKRYRQNILAALYGEYIGVHIALSFAQPEGTGLSPILYTVTHIPTGLRLSHARLDRVEAHRLAEKILAAGLDWSSNDPTTYGSAHSLAILEAVNAMREELGAAS